MIVFGIVLHGVRVFTLSDCSNFSKCINDKAVSVVDKQFPFIFIK